MASLLSAIQNSFSAPSFPFQSRVFSRAPIRVSQLGPELNLFALAQQSSVREIPGPGASAGSSGLHPGQGACLTSSSCPSTSVPLALPRRTYLSSSSSDSFAASVTSSSDILHWQCCTQVLGATDPFRLWVESECSDCEITTIRGALRRNLSFWKELTSDPDLLKVVSSGYSPSFSEPLPPFWAKNNTTAEDHKEFVLQSLAELFLNGFADLLPYQPSVVNPFSVSIRANRKKRLIVDLRHLNQFLVPPKFKLDDYHTALPALRGANFLFAFDLKKGYYHVELEEAIRDLFGFSFSFKGKTYFGRWNICPFGLSTTPFLFTKLLKPLLARWRALGLHIFIYLDDGLALCNCWDEALWFSHIVRSDLHSSGFHEQELKCLWDPQTTAPWLGIVIDLLSHTLAYTEECKEWILKALKAFLSSSISTPRLLLGIAGQINSLSLVIGSRALIDTKIFYKETLPHIKNRFCWDIHFSVSDESRAAALAWQTFFLQFGGSRSFLSKGDPVVIFSNASASGSGAFIASPKEVNAKDKYLPLEEGPLQSICLCSWSDSEKVLSSTWRELKIVEEGLRAFRKQLQGKEVHWFLDNLGGTSVIRRGSMKANLNPLAKLIADWCDSEDISLSISWIRRDYNEDADRLSWFIDLDDWSLSQELCRQLQQRWFGCSVDRFANGQNHRLPRFNSCFSVPGCEAVDAFSQVWSQELNWLVPPPSLIALTIEHLIRDKAKGILVCPRWPSSPFWPFLFRRCGPAPFIREFRIIHRAGRYLIPGNQSASIFSPAIFKGDLIAFLLDAS